MQGEYVRLRDGITNPAYRPADPEYRVAYAGEVFRIVRVDRGAYVTLVLQAVDDIPPARIIRVEPMDVEWPIEITKTDGSVVLAWPDPDEPWIPCVCGMVDSRGVVTGNDCRSLGCDPHCPKCNQEEGE